MNEEEGIVLPQQPVSDPTQIQNPAPPEPVKPHDPERYTRAITGIVVIVIILLLITGVLAFTAHDTFNAIANAFWLVMFCLVFLFLLLGVLVMIGMKNQVKQILDFFIEGTLTIVDLMDFLKRVATYVVETVKQVIYLLIPFIAYLLGALIYFALIYGYKWVGKQYDVTLLTIGLTIVLIILTGALNTKGKGDAATELSWGKQIQFRMKDYFGDAVEVVLFIFFLTMDNTHLFFLPSDLNVPLHASLFGFDLMPRGWTFDSTIKQTFTIVMVAVGVEILRFIVRIVTAGYNFYKEINTYIGETHESMSNPSQVKWALRQSFEVHKDDVVRFITYTTFIIFVFLAFPRLKILAMAVSSITAFILDFLIPDRLVIKKGHDLFSKLITLLFKV